jgi:hypothetical protein
VAVACSCERATAARSEGSKGSHEQEPQSKSGTRVDEEMRKAARRSVRFEKIGTKMIRVGAALVFGVLASAVLGQNTTCLAE